VDQTRIHCDHVDGLGDFVELEVVLEDGQDEESGVKVAEELMGKLGVKKEDLVSGAYVDLLCAQH
jgi:predicted adenylyl cyclase CyaB